MDCMICVDLDYVFEVRFYIVMEYYLEEVFIFDRGVF